MNNHILKMTSSGLEVLFTICFLLDLELLCFPSSSFVVIFATCKPVSQGCNGRATCISQYSSSVLIGSTRFKEGLLSSSERTWRSVDEALGTREPYVQVFRVTWLCFKAALALALIGSFRVWDWTSASRVVKHNSVPEQCTWPVHQCFQ